MIRWWNSLPFKRQVFFTMTAALCMAALLVEFVFEPIVEDNFFTANGYIDWHEAPIWLFGALLCGAGLGAVFTRAVMRRLDRLARATAEITRGNFSARVPEEGNPDDVFAHLTASFNTMAETVDHLLHNERRLLSDISHELRSPLARASAAVELLLLKNADNGNTAYLRKVDADLTHMNDLVSVLLEQSRNRLAAREGRETVDVTSVAVDLADGYRMQGAAQKKELLSELDADVYVDGHPMQIRLIMENLLGNALFYAPVDSRVEMRLRRSGDNAVFSVRDHGPGIPEADKEAIFRPFFRVDASRTRESGGVGLGLTLVREACEALGGSVRAENAEPGLEVTATLPLSKRPPPNPNAVTEAASL